MGTPITSENADLLPSASTSAALPTETSASPALFGIQLRFLTVAEHGWREPFLMRIEVFPDRTG